MSLVTPLEVACSSVVHNLMVVREGQLGIRKRLCYVGELTPFFIRRQYLPHLIIGIVFCKFSIYKLAQALTPPNVIPYTKFHTTYECFCFKSVK